MGIDLVNVDMNILKEIPQFLCQNNFRAPISFLDFELCWQDIGKDRFRMYVCKITLRPAEEEDAQILLQDIVKEEVIPHLQANDRCRFHITTNYDNSRTCNFYILVKYDDTLSEFANTLPSLRRICGW